MSKKNLQYAIMTYFKQVEVLSKKERNISRLRESMRKSLQEYFHIVPMTTCLRDRLKNSESNYISTITCNA